MRQDRLHLATAVLALVAIMSLIPVGLAASTSGSTPHKGTSLNQEAVVASISGSAWVMHDADPDSISAAVQSFSESGTPGWTRLRAGDPLAKRDLVVVSTSEDSTLSLVCSDMSVLHLGPGSVLFIQDSLKPAGGFLTFITSLWRKPSLRMILGSLWASVTKRITPGSQFQVETPAAVAGVRGTKFQVSVSETGATSVYVEEGTVEVRGLQRSKPLGAPVVLTAGQATYVEPGRPPAPPSDLPEEVRKAKAFGKSGRPDDKPVPPGQSKGPKDKLEDANGSRVPPEHPSEQSGDPGDDQTQNSKNPNKGFESTRD